MKISGSILQTFLVELQENIYGENFSLSSCCWVFFVSFCFEFDFFFFFFYYALICKKYATELH